MCNACEQSCIVMLVAGSEMSKTEYDLKAIMYFAHDTTHRLCNIRGNWNIQQPSLPPNILFSVNSNRREKSSCFHDDVIKWKHFPRYWPFGRGIHRSPVNSSHKGQWRGALMFSLICVWINGWVNNREAGDLRRHRAHYDVIVMCFQWLLLHY